MKVLLFPSTLTVEQIQAIVTPLRHVELCGVIAIGERQYNDWRQKFPGVPAWESSALGDVSNQSPETRLHQFHEEIVDKLIQDSRVFYMLEEEYNFFKISNIFNSVKILDTICWNSLWILEQTRPDKVVIASTPHSVVTYSLCKAAEHLGIPVFFTSNRHTALPWKVTVMRGIDQQEMIRLSHNENAEGRLSDQAVLHLANLRAGYDRAIPTYESVSRTNYRNILSTVWHELKMLLYRTSLKGLPIRTFDLIMKFLAYRSMISRTDAIPADLRYVVFFLHFQREKSTLPEGYKYSQQWFAIRTLSRALSRHEMSLVIREHPTTFRHPFDSYVRDASFYRAIKALPNTLIVGLSSDPFHLIDNCVAVATVTGTSGFEAIARGKPAIVFGAAQYRDAPGCHCVESCDDVDETLKSILSGVGLPSDEETRRFMARMEQSSFDLNRAINTSLEAMQCAIALEVSVPCSSHMQAPA